MMADYTAVSWNINGGNGPIKRAKCLDLLHRKKIQIAFIQETHLKPVDVHRFQNKHFKVLASSCVTNKTKGVLILVNRKLSLTLHNTGGDSEGRFCYAYLTLNNNKFCFASLYGPNDFDQTFFDYAKLELLQFGDTKLVLGGDFNLTVDPTLDKSHQSPQLRIPPSLSYLHNFMSDLNIVDPWCLRNPGVKDFTFFSGRHKTYSRIDYILVSSSCLKYVTATEILPMLLSDHAPVLLTLSLTPTIPRSKRWRFNVFLLKNEQFMLSIIQELKLFIRLNDTPDVSPHTLWEATKCFIRGNSISFASSLSKNRREKMVILEKSICELETLQKQSFDEDRSQSLNSLKAVSGYHKCESRILTLKNQTTLL